MWYGEVDIMKSPTLSTNESSAQLRSRDLRRNFRSFLKKLSTPAFKLKPLMYSRRFHFNRKSLGRNCLTFLWPRLCTNFEDFFLSSLRFFSLVFLHSKRSPSWILFRILAGCKLIGVKSKKKKKKKKKKTTKQWISEDIVLLSLQFACGQNAGKL